MADHFYIRVRGRVQGPFDCEKLRQLARRGQFSRLHEVSTDGQQWQSAKDFPELFASATTPAATTSSAPAQAAPTPANTGAANYSSVTGAPLSPTPVSGSWYYAYGGNEQGPVDFATLSNLFATRQLQPETEVWNQGLVNWVPAANVPGLVPAASPFAKEHVGNVHVATTEGAIESREVSTAVTRALIESRPWVVFISVIAFVYAALMLTGGVLQVIVGARTAVFPVTASGLFNMVFAAVVSFGAKLLVNYAGWISRVERSQRDSSLCAAMSTLKTFWSYVGIVLIVALALLVVISILLLSMAGSFPDFG